MKTAPSLTFEWLDEAHAEGLYEGFSDVQVSRLTAENPPGSLEDLRREFAAFNAGPPPGSAEIWMNWVIRESGAEELVGTVQVNAPSDGLTGTTISGGLAAQLIDELPVIAAIAPYTKNGIRIRDAKELRVKESDRIALVASNLRAMGAEVEEFKDGLDVPGNQQLHAAEIDAGGDHRIAMAFSVAALRATGETVIRGAESAAISFPEFFELLDRVAER